MTDDSKKITKHTLERIVEELRWNFDEEKVHTAMLLAYAQAIFGVVRSDNCVVSPLYRIIYDETNNNVSMEETLGSSIPPQKNALNISLMDEIFCSNIRDIPLLLEGETGIGKTYAATRYLATVLQKEHYFSHRLSANAFLNNLFSHFQEGKMVNGMPVIEAKIDSIENCAGGMTDEINRGDSNESLQMFDNEMHLGGTVYDLGIPIPELKVDAKNKKVEVKTKRKKKKLLLLCAQNPAGTDDAKFTQTMQLDAAVDNRLLKTNVGNAAASAGSTLWLGESKGKKHARFMDHFTKKVCEYLGITWAPKLWETDKSSVFANLEQDWLSVYAWITEAERTDKPILYSAMELSDLMFASFSGNLIDYYNYERKVIKYWEDKLKKGVVIKDSLKETEHVKKLQAVTDSFKVPIIFRDIVQMKKLADVLATLKNVKDAVKSSNPVGTYLKTDRYVTVREVVGATCLLARNKQPKTAEAPIEAINQVLTQYLDLLQDYMKDANYLTTKFDLFDPNAGIKKIAVVKSIRDALDQGLNVDYLTEKIAEHATTLKNKVSATQDIRNVLIARSVGDLMTLCGFLQQYKTEINPILKKFAGKKAAKDPYEVPLDMIDQLGDFYYRKVEEDAMVMEDIYLHRIQRTLGV